MKRAFLAATVATAALLAGGIGVVALLTRPVPTTAPPEPLAPPSTPVAPVSGAPAPPRPPVAAPSIQPTGATARTYPKAPADPSAAPDADRVTRKVVHRALHAARVQSQLTRCTKPWEFGGTAADGGRPPRAEPASLVLELQALGGELRIVDAKVRRWGGASEAMVSCARTVLRGQIIPAPRTRRPAGARLRMDFSLNPRTEAVASSR